MAVFKRMKRWIQWCVTATPLTSSPASLKKEKAPSASSAANDEERCAAEYARSSQKTQSASIEDTEGEEEREAEEEEEEEARLSGKSVVVVQDPDVDDDHTGGAVSEDGHEEIVTTAKSTTAASYEREVEEQDQDQQKGAIITTATTTTSTTPPQPPQQQQQQQQQAKEEEESKEEQEEENITQAPPPPPTPTPIIINTTTTTATARFADVLASLPLENSAAASVLPTPSAPIASTAPPPSFRSWQEFTHDYTLKETIGQGTFGKIKRTVSVHTNAVVATKLVKTKSKPSLLKTFRLEVSILRDISHPHIVAFHGAFFDGIGTHAMVMEYLDGGELFGYIQKHDSGMPENIAAAVTKQVLLALRHLHDDLCVAHRDIKPENILFASHNPVVVKLTDFGFAKRLRDASAVAFDDDIRHAFSTRLGSPNYVAPEIVSRKRGYTTQVDIWSLGVILYIMLCGYFPFYAESEKELYRQIRRGSFEMPDEEWVNISKGAVDVVKRMIVVDPHVRATARECLELSWVAAAEGG
ncbi:calcium-dependent protein kinase [Pycnococcus provasolii]